VTDITLDESRYCATAHVRRAVVLLHGYGADGDDLIGLAQVWQEKLPDTAFLAPHAPFPCEAAPMGRQWFAFEGRSEAQIAPGVERAALILNRYLDDVLARNGLAPAALALVGFSQGAMMALHVGLARAVSVAGIVGYSGRLLVAGVAVSRPPVLLVHGEEDPLVPAIALAQAERALKAQNVPVDAVLRPGLGHAIDEEGLALGAAVLARVLAPAA
jgi:phospholipase/carboxylesterase